MLIWMFDCLRTKFEHIDGIQFQFLVMIVLVDRIRLAIACFVYFVHELGFVDLLSMTLSCLC